MLGRIFPKQIDNAYRGYKLAIWLLAAIVLLRLAMSGGTLFQTLFAPLVDNFTTLSDNFGKMTEHWNGMDFTFNARPRSGFTVQGGISTGRRSTDVCEIQAKLPETQLVFGIGWSGALAAGEWTLTDAHIDLGWPLLAAMLFIGNAPVTRPCTNSRPLIVRCWSRLTTP